MSFVKILTDVDGVISSIPARIISTEKDGSFNIKYISRTEKKHTNGKTIYEYEDEIYNITEESIDEYMYDETECGFRSIGNGDQYIKQSNSRDGDDDEDGDYEPGSSEEETESDGDDSEEDSEEDFEEDEDLEEFDD
jgi:hypothetical protein